MKYIAGLNKRIKTPFGDISLKLTDHYETDGNWICKGDNKICYTTSQNAYDYFANNDDGNGLLRFTKTHDILDVLKAKNNEYNQAVAQAIDGIEDEEEKASIIAGVPYPLKDFWDEVNENHSSLLKNGSLIGSYNFYNASISELEELENLLESL